MMHKYVYKLTQLFCNRTKIIVFPRLMLGLWQLVIYSFTYQEFLYFHLKLTLLNRRQGFLEQLETIAICLQL